VPATIMEWPGIRNFASQLPLSTVKCGGKENQMELDRALELAVVSSWDELINPGEMCSVHVEYKNITAVPLTLVEVWTIRQRGYGTLAFRYVASGVESSAPHMDGTVMQFANSYHSDTLANNLDFIMRNQSTFTRPIDHSTHGLIQIETPNEEDRKKASVWLDSIRMPLAAGHTGAVMP
jgi:hypothetical protein